MKLVIIGAGEYGQVVADVAIQLGYEIIFLDDNSSLALGPCSDYVKYNKEYIIPAFGNNNARLEWINKLTREGFKIPSLIHPSAYVSPGATVSKGCVILPHSIVNTNVKIEEGCIINIGAIVDHGNVLKSCVHVAPGAIIKADNVIPSCMKIESGVVINNRQYQE